MPTLAELQSAAPEQVAEPIPSRSVSGPVTPTPSNYVVRGGPTKPYRMSDKVPEQIQVLQDELKDPTLSEDDRAGIQRELKRLGGAPKDEQAPAKGAVSFAELTGGKPTAEKPTSAPTAAPSPSAPWSASRLGSNAAALGDVIWGVVPMAGGQFLDSVERTKEFMKAIPYMRSGADIDAAWKAAGMKGRLEARHMNEMFGQPFQKAMNYFGADKDYSESSVNQAMTKLSGWLEKGTDYVVEKSGGAISKDDAETLRDDLMLVAPVGFGKLAKRALGGKIADTKLTPDEASAVLDRHLAENKPTPQQIEAQVAPEPAPPPLTLREVNLPPEPPPKPPIGQQVGAVPKTRSAETPIVGGEEPPAITPPIETGAPASLDSGLAKLRTGRAWDMTPEERIATRNQGKAPDIVDESGKPINNAQSGRADVELLAKLGLGVGGGLAAASLVDEDKLEAFIAGGTLGVGSTMIPRYARALASDTARTITNTAGVAGATAGLAYLNHDHPIEGAMLGILYGATKALPKPDLVATKLNNLTIDDRVNLYNGAIAAEARKVFIVSDAIRTLVPDKARREALADVIEQGNTASLTGPEAQVASVFRNFMDSYGTAAKNEGLIKDFVDNYVTHIVEKENLPKSKIQEALDAVFGEQSGTGAAGGNARFGKARKYDTFADLNAALQGTGLKLATKDIADVVDIYGRSMSRAIENKRFIDNLKQSYENPIVPAANPLIMDLAKAPRDYTTINNPQMRGLAVHPELAEPLKFVLQSDSPGAVRAGLLALSMAQKRLLTGLSLFHASNLINAYIGARGMGSFKGTAPINAALKMYKAGGAGDSIDVLLRNGLRVDPPIEVQPGAIGAIGSLADGLVKQATGFDPMVGKATLGAVEKVQTQFFDKVTWNYLHTGLKLSTAIYEFERGILKNPNMAPGDVARQVASYVNDTYGGLDWYRVASETQTAITRKIAMSTLNPTGRSFLQIGMFAPDWTLSTFRAMYKALPGATDMPLTAQLHQKYVARTAALYLTLMNAYNVAASGGHPMDSLAQSNGTSMTELGGQYIWDNKDPTKIQHEDGTRQQVAKHAMEGYEWAHAPRQTALNKLGVAVKLPAELLFQKKYLSSEGHAPPIESNTQQVLGAFTPITVSGASVEGRSPEQNVENSLKSMIGAPVYGMTKDEKELAKVRRKQIREAQKARDKEKGK